MSAWKSLKLTQGRFATVRKVHPRGLNSTAGTWPDAAVEADRKDQGPAETQTPRQRLLIAMDCRDAAVVLVVYNFAANTHSHSDC